MAGSADPTPDPKLTAPEAGDEGDPTPPARGRRAPAAPSGRIAELEAQLAEFQRRDMTESQRLSADLKAARDEITARDARDASAKRERALETLANDSNAKYPSKIPALLAASGLDLDKASTREIETAIGALRKEMPEIFKTPGSADGAAGRGSNPGVADPNGAMNAFIRNAARGAHSL